MYAAGGISPDDTTSRMLIELSLRLIASIGIMFLGAVMIGNVICTERAASRLGSSYIWRVNAVNCGRVERRNLVDVVM